MKQAPRTRIVILTLLTTLCVLGGGVYGQRFFASKKSPPKRKPVMPRVRLVEVVKATPVTHTVTLSAYASAKPARTVQLPSEVSGKVASANPALRPGGFISKGDPLFAIDQERLRIRVESLTADVSRTKARLRSLAVQRKGARQTVKDSRAAVALTRKQLSRDEKLAAEGHLSGSVADRTRLELNQRVERLHTAETQADTLAHTVAQTQAELTGAEKALEQAELDRTRSAVAAPFDLQVVSSRVEEGAWLNAGQTAVVVDDISAVELGVPIPADDLTWLPVEGPAPQNRAAWVDLLVGRSARVYRTGSNGKSREWAATITRVAAGLSEQTRMVTLFAHVTEPVASTPRTPPLPLLPGMFCRVDIPGRAVGDVYVLPRKALQEPDMVYLAKADDTLLRRPVEVLRIAGDTIVISKGLAPMDRVITTTLGDAVDGTPLKLRETVQPQAVTEHP